MIFNILGLIAGPLMIKSGIGLLVVLGWLWVVGAIIGVVWFIISLLIGAIDR